MITIAAAYVLLLFQSSGFDPAKAQHMTAGGWIFMAGAWIFILSLTFYSFSKILRGGRK